jgi:hypothetical protein
MFYDREDEGTTIFRNYVPIYQHTRSNILEDLNLSFQITFLAVEKNNRPILEILLQRTVFKNTY